MPFCPICRDEYELGISTCADCGSHLVDVLEEPSKGGDFTSLDPFLVPIFIPENFIQADVIKQILEAEGIEAIYTDVFTGGKAGPKIWTQKDDCSKARGIIQQAIEDGIIPDEGEFVLDGSDG